MSAPGIELGAGIQIGAGVGIGPAYSVGVSFTVTSADFASGESYGGGTQPQGINGTGGFINPNTGSLEANGYAFITPSPGLTATLTSAFAAAGIATDGSTYAWNVTWGAGSTTSSGIVRLGWNSGGQTLIMSAMNPSDNSWQNSPTGSNNEYAASLAGTFLLPATFTAYTPLNQVGSANEWC